MSSMKIGLDHQNSGEIKCRNEGDINSVWPYRIKLEPDSMRWDSLKILPSREFEVFILQKMSEATQKALEMWQPVQISMYDVDTHETYKVQLTKKESFWFEPLPDIGQKKGNSVVPSGLEKQSCSFSNESREMTGEKFTFAYSLQPFRYIVRKRGLSYDQEIRLNWSGSRTVNRMEFSVLQAPRFELQNFRI